MQKHINTFIGCLLLGMALSTQAALPSATAEGEKLPSLAPMLEKTLPAVVNISVTANVSMNNPLMQDPFFRHFFNVPQQPRQQKKQSAGSGVIVDAKAGYVVTNDHVISGADAILVKLDDGREFPAKLIGTDPEVDIAILQIEPDNLVEIKLADSDALRVGDFAVAIGNPFGLNQTVTSGIVSGLKRSGLGIEGYESFIQTDASINPGNSGGALVNLRGELIGINTAIKTPSGGNVGIGFAIPSNMTKSIMDQLIAFGEVRRGRLGVFIQDVTPELRGYFSAEGVAITQVEPGSAADSAGLQAGDVIVALDGKPIKRAAELRNVIGMMQIGETVDLEFVRNGKNQSVTTAIGDPTEKRVAGRDALQSLRGATLRSLTANEQREHGNGLLVVNVEQESAAEKADLRKGDIIVSANQVNIDSVDALREIAKQSDELLLLIHREGGHLFILVK